MKYSEMKIHGEWLCTEDNEIIELPLREWFETLAITPAFYNFPTAGYHFSTRDMETWKSAEKRERNGYIDIFKHGGYGLKHDEYEAYKECLFYADNADIGDIKLKAAYTG